MSYKVKDKTIREEVEQNLVNKFNSFGLSISFDTDDEEAEGETEEEIEEENEEKEENN
ncbi:MAG: hypothetical protein J1F35_05515 [Erysipelotrichales bacterium]|nr:hypothetical protein [Erysipelotrichales bacterium]